MARRDSPSRTRLEWFLIAGSTLVTLVIGAGFLQFFYSPPSEVSGWRTATIMAGQIAPEELNELGFRGQSIRYADEDRVVLLVGDSQVEAKPGCGFWWMPERRLERHLKAVTGMNVRVFTLGSSGYGQDQQLLVLREYFSRYRADLVVLWETPLNDVWNNLFSTHWPANGTPKPTFRLVDGQLVGPSEIMGETIPAPQNWFSALVQRLVRQQGRDETWEQYLPPPYSPLSVYDGPVNLAWERAESKLAHENLDTEKSHRALFLTPPSPRMQYGIQLTRRLMQEAQRVAEGHGATYVTVVTPLVLTERHPVRNLEPETYRFRGKYYRVSRRQHDDTIRKINEGFQAYEIPVTVEHPYLGPADGHLNEHAVDQVMHELAAKLGPLIQHALSRKAS